MDEKDMELFQEFLEFKKFKEIQDTIQETTTKKKKVKTNIKNVLMVTIRPQFH